MDELPVGRYGTIHYMSNTGTEIPIASYPIDESIITIGGQSQHIRLYDPWVSDLHCRLVFEEGKAFLVILGQNGVIIDGSNFNPSHNDASPTTVPLTNGSEWLISKRRFIFQYPPKEQRAKLIATPKSRSRKSLRMSMVNSAQLWTPTIPKTQAESLQLLKTPIKPYTEGKDKDLYITLVEGDALHVARTTEEVVVVESVNNPEPLPEPVPQPAFAPTPPKAPQTPGRQPRASLHRQVLVMNSHRKQAQLDEQEEQEIEASLFDEEPSDEEANEYSDEFEDDAGSNPFLEEDYDLSRSTNDLNESTEPNPFSANGMNGKSFRASLGSIGSIRPYGRPSGTVFHSPAPHQKVSDDQQPPEDEDDYGEEQQEPSTPSNKRPLGSFLTPQVSRAGSGILPRQSVGGPSRHMDIDEDIEQARKRLAGLGTAPRPQMVQLDDDPQSTSTPSVPQSIKRGKASLTAIPELASPLPSARGRFSLATIPEPKFEESGSNQQDVQNTPKDETASDPSLRLQKLMRTVEDVARRESIREARRSMAGPVDFYTASPSANGITYGSNRQESRAMDISNDHHLPYPNTTAPPLHQDEPTMLIDEVPISRHDDAASVEEEAPKKKTTKAGKKTTSKKKADKTTSFEDQGDDEMQVDEPEIHPHSVKAESSEDVMMEEDPIPELKATRKTRRGATPDTSVTETTATRRGRTKKVASEDEPSISENSTSTRKGRPKAAGTEDITLETISEDPSTKTTSRSRRGAKSTTTTEPEAVEAPHTTAPRRGGRSKGVTTTPIDEEEDSSTLDVPAPTAKATGGKGRKAKAASKEKEDSVDSVKEEDEIDTLPRATSTRRTPRSRTTPQPQSSSQQEIGESSQDTEEVPAPKKTTRKAATATRKVNTEGDTTRSDKENASMDSDVPPAPVKAAPKARKKAAAAEEAPAETSSQTTAKRTTRTKR